MGQAKSFERLSEAALVQMSERWKGAERGPYLVVTDTEKLMDNWLIANIGAGADGKVIYLTTDCVHASELCSTAKPGRNTCVHTADVPTMLGRDGVIGLKDFPGLVIQEYTKAGWIYHGRVTIDKNPQSQALRTHSKGLLFSQMEKDSSWSRPALGDYILVFRKPGDNAVPIKPDVTRQEWILWARAVWYAADYTPGSWDVGGDQTRKSGESNLYGIRETDTLQYRSARDNDDERHVCPLQLGTIERCVRLWSNKGETVLSPFAGIGSEGYQSLKLGRKFIGIELKESYFKVAAKNLERALHDDSNQLSIFDMLGQQEATD